MLFMVLFPGTLDGENYFLSIGKIYFGNIVDTVYDTSNPLIGYLQNVYFDNIDIFSALQKLGSGESSYLLDIYILYV